ncbi:MAG: hypothetical protein HYU66_23745 [Armatimonadetes bacterium]|nr:hypothetical protein [Armatimonadota bacterium]
MAAAVACPNREINLQMCPCPNDECERRGICCECVQAHYAVGKPNACARMPARDPKTMDLVPLAKVCPTNLERNLEFCPCGCKDCGKQGTCCECVRLHYKPDGNGVVACMKGLL